MLSDNLIQKLFDTQDHSRMIGCLADNGTTLPLALQSRLTLPIAAAGLGLRRLVELTYGPTPLSRDMTAALLDGQLGDGSFTGSSDRDPLATAAAVAGLAAVLREHHGISDSPPDLTDALDRAIAALSTMQMEDGLFCHSDDRTIEDRALTSVFVLFMLARLPIFREAVRFADLMTWFDERADRLDNVTLELYHMARLDDPARQPVMSSPTLAGMAA